MNRRVFLRSALAIGAATSAPGFATAQTYPTRLIKLVVPSPAGGPHEVAVRILADRLSSSLRQPVIVENLSSGAGGAVGAKVVANAEPDGHTLLVTLPGVLVAAPALYKNLGYDPAKDFAPIATVFSAPGMLVVNPALSAKSIQDLVAHARANPGKINFPSAGYGTAPHLLGEMFKQMAGIDIVHVPYKGAAAGITDLLAGRMQMGFQVVPLLLPHVEGGKLRPLAVTDETRSLLLPDVPTTIESGFPRLQSTTWLGVLAPAGTDPNIVNKLNAAINEILKSKEMEASLAKLDARPKIGSPQDFAVFMAAERQKWTEVINTAGIKAE